MNFALYIEHTLLKPETREGDIRKLCAEAITHSFFGVCVNSSYIALAKSVLKNQSKVVSVVGFPLGACATKTKASETADAVENGADEIDMVIHLGFLKDQRRADVINDIRSVVEAAQGQPVKVILETGLLTQDEKILACHLARDAGAHFVKTCTGFASGQAEVSDIQLMHSLVGAGMGVKASGGVRTPEKALALIQAGATRLGTSSGVQLVGGMSSQGSY